jgi:hypothetical protein
MAGNLPKLFHENEKAFSVALPTEKLCWTKR